MKKPLKHIALMAGLAIASVTGLALRACSKSEPAPHVQSRRRETCRNLANSKANQELQDKLVRNGPGLANVTTNATTYVASNPRYSPAEDWKG